jgi:hypothetical protein
MATIGTDIRFGGEADTLEERPGEDGRFTVRKAAQLGYGIAALAVLAGWLLNRHGHLVDPVSGVGYWLGIVGASLMAVLLLYPLRKKLRFMGYFGATRHWFRMHMLFGVLGPVLILFHSNFALGSLNSNVALICMLLVAGSGLVGRYIHAKVYADLDGNRTTLRELAAKAGVTAQQRAHVAVLVPELLERITVFDKAVLEPPLGIAAALLLPAKLAFTTRWEGIRLRRMIGRRFRELARKSPIIAKQQKRLQGAVARFALEHLRRVRKVAELNSYERMFGLWHLFHLPFFYMMVVTALVHVVAVHMY